MNFLTSSFPLSTSSKLKSLYTMPSSKNRIASVESDPCKSLNKYFAISFADVGVLRTNCGGGLGTAFAVAALRRSIIKFPGLYSGSGISLTYRISLVAGSNSTKVVPRNPSSDDDGDVHVHAKPHAADPSDILSIRKPGAPSAPPPMPVRASALDARCSSTAERPTMGLEEAWQSSNTTSTAHALANFLAPSTVEKHPSSLISDRSRDRAARDFRPPLIPLPFGDDDDDPTLPLLNMDDRKESKMFWMSPPPPLAASLRGLPVGAVASVLHRMVLGLMVAVAVGGGAL